MAKHTMFTAGRFKILSIDGRSLGLAFLSSCRIFALTLLLFLLFFLSKDYLFIRFKVLVFYIFIYLCFGTIESLLFSFSFFFSHLWFNLLFVHYYALYFCFDFSKLNSELIFVYCSLLFCRS